MKNILTLNLENDMDLMLVHKRVMKLSELCGLSLPVQTIFATAVSEIARIAIERGQKASLSMGIIFLRGHKKQLQAVISDEKAFCSENSEAIVYARRLADEVLIESEGAGVRVILRHSVLMGAALTEAKVQSFIDYFKNERPLSPYDELRRKNLQLEELASRLRESEYNYSLLTNSLPLMMFSVEHSGKILYTNKWLRDFLGFNISHLNAIQCQPFLHPEDYQDIYTRWKNSRGAFQAFHGQIRLKQIDSGQYIWHLISILPLKAEHNHVAQWMGFLVDIHAQKLVEQTLKDNSELKAAQKKLQQYQQDLENKIVALNRSNHDLEQFAYIASHDLQEPLRKIRTFVNMLERDIDNKQNLEKYFGKIENAAERMALLVNGVLDYSRITSKETAFEKINLNKILKQVESDFESLIVQKDAIIQSDNLPELYGQPLQFRQLFSNLLSNALKFSTEEPVITISATSLTPNEVIAHPELKPDRAYVLISFQDNGIGFDPQYSSKIFTIFQRLHGREVYGGTGIGLALCKKIVERHDGWITAISRPGKGATFQIFLPTSKPAADHLAVDPT